MVFSCEMSAFQLVQRLLSPAPKFAMSQLSRGYTPNKGEIQRVQRAAVEIAQSKLFIDDTAGISINELPHLPRAALALRPEALPALLEQAIHKRPAAHRRSIREIPHLPPQHLPQGHIPARCQAIELRRHFSAGHPLFTTCVIALALLIHHFPRLLLALLQQNHPVFPGNLARPVPRVGFPALVRHDRAHQARLRLGSAPAGGPHRLAITAPAILRRVLHHPARTGFKSM
jgi:hypothetical protein